MCRAIIGETGYRGYCINYTAILNECRTKWRPASLWVKSMRAKRGTRWEVEELSGAKKILGLPLKFPRCWCCVGDLYIRCISNPELLGASIFKNNADENRSYRICFGTSAIRVTLQATTVLEPVTMSGHIGRTSTLAPPHATCRALCRTHFIQGGHLMWA